MTRLLLPHMYTNRCESLALCPFQQGLGTATAIWLHARSAPATAPEAWSLPAIFEASAFHDHCTHCDPHRNLMLQSIHRAVVCSARCRNYGEHRRQLQTSFRWLQEALKARWRGQVFHHHSRRPPKCSQWYPRKAEKEQDCSKSQENRALPSGDGAVQRYHRSVSEHFVAALFCVGADEVHASCKLINHIIDKDHNLYEHHKPNEVYSMSF